MSIPVVYEDDWILVVDKPSGLLTIPTPKKEMRTLTSILGLYPCHRLDRDTSGLIIYARTKSIQKKMMQAFKEKKVKKTYLAFVRGIPCRNQGQIHNPIEGNSALTKYRVLKKLRGFSVVEVIPLTGRTNQIRIHFKQIGHPILGEERFAFRRDFKIKAKRLCLHAAALEFPHPVTKKYLRLSVDLPRDLKEFLEQQGGMP
ncbi:MAG: RluA family pseudouridine synthase [Candidatus Omnitrophica bacterium]|nr:RluA family pseudouridine synthase [Candidatus Omnitrophota bacterium]